MVSRLRSVGQCHVARIVCQLGLIVTTIERPELRVFLVILLKNIYNCLIKINRRSLYQA